MAYKKHTWGSGIPNRNKFEEMDNAIESVAPSNDGTNGQVLTKTSTGAKWQNASGGTAGDVTYDSSITYPNGTVGKEITSLSEKIVNLGSYSTTERVVGKWIDNETDVWEKTITGVLGTEGVVELDSSFTHKVIKADGFLENQEQTSRFCVPNAQVNTNNLYAFIINDYSIGKLKMEKGSAFNGWTYYITLQYTKS